ncbi:MAG: hypothetical protein PHQ43_00110 [Dehalococcoidales bacterium]|nr:hypothetical protein [Dehalococcoidales bacterium]
MAQAPLIHKYDDPIDTREGRDKFAEATNKQQRRLVRAYDSWALEVRKQIADVGMTGENSRLIILRELPKLEEQLLGIINGGVLEAAGLSAKNMISTPQVQATIMRHLQDSTSLVHGNLIPAIERKLTQSLAGGALSDKAALKVAFDAMRFAPAEYSGGYWVAIWDVQKTVGEVLEGERRMKGLAPDPIRWVLDPSAQHCEHRGDRWGCSELAREYESWTDLPTVPAGKVSCYGNCRCRLATLRDGKWTTGGILD